MKKYIVFRYYFNAIFYTYERVELTEEELKDYLFKHQKELENIEIFRKEWKVEANLSVDITIK